MRYGTRLDHLSQVVVMRHETHTVLNLTGSRKCSLSSVWKDRTAPTSIMRVEVDEFIKALYWLAATRVTGAVILTHSNLNCVKFKTDIFGIYVQHKQL